MILKELLDLLGCWSKIKVLDWSVPETREDYENQVVLFYGYAEDTPYRLINYKIVTQKEIDKDGADTSPLLPCHDGEAKTSYLQVWVIDPKI